MAELTVEQYERLVDTTGARRATIGIVQYGARPLGQLDTSSGIVKYDKQGICEMLMEDYTDTVMSYEMFCELVECNENSGMDESQRLTRNLPSMDGRSYATGQLKLIG